MKIIEIHVEQDDGTVTTKLYVGNEFSPDPLDVLQKVAESKKAQLYSTGDPNCVEFSTSPANYFGNVHDVNAILRKDGYTVFEPKTIGIYIDEE